MVERSPEKAGVGGSTPSLATIILKNLVAKNESSPPTIPTQGNKLAMSTDYPARLALDEIIAVPD